MKITAVCPTYKRPRLLGRAVHCFLQQDHKDCELIILDDAGQYTSQEHERWKLVSVPDRFDCLADKRQAVIEMASPDSDGFMCWDDDDVCFPGAVAAVAKALEKYAWAQCRIIYETASPGVLAPTQAFNDRKYRRVGDGRVVNWGYGGCWAYRLKEFHDLNGYKNLKPSASEDIDLAGRFYLNFGESADSSIDGPWYWYNRNPGVTKVSDQGMDFWRMREQWPFVPMYGPSVGWNGHDLYQYKILPGVQPRPF